VADLGGSVQGKTEPSKKPVAIVEQIARYYV
jgi:hypothetical protein